MSHPFVGYFRGLESESGPFGARIDREKSFFKGMWPLYNSSPGVLTPPFFETWTSFSGRLAISMESAKIEEIYAKMPKENIVHEKQDLDDKLGKLGVFYHLYPMFLNFFLIFLALNSPVRPSVTKKKRRGLKK